MTCVTSHLPPPDGMVHALAWTERSLNSLGYVAGVVTGPLRILIGKVEVFIGSIFVCLHDLAYCIKEEQDEELIKRSEAWSHIVGHGLLNIVRGIVESFHFLGTVFLLGAYDALAGRCHYIEEEVLEEETCLNPYHPQYSFREI